MDKKLATHHRKIILITFSTFFVFASFIIGVFFIILLSIFSHDYEESKCFEAINKWYMERYGSIADVEGKRWQQHLECEKNMGFFPWGKEARFSK